MIDLHRARANLRFEIELLELLHGVVPSRAHDVEHLQALSAQGLQERRENYKSVMLSPAMLKTSSTNEVMLKSTSMPMSMCTRTC